MRITEGSIKALCSDIIYKRGCEYFSEGRVHLKKRSETELSAAVDGEKIFNVYITMDDEKITSELCTCAYYETMKSPCKHIIAVLKQRLAELDDGMCITNENDRIAESLCYEFSSRGERERVRASFELFIKSNRGGEPQFQMTLSLPELGGEVQGLENFLDCYLNYREFKIDRTNVYDRRKMYFQEHEDTIIKILAEVYQTRSSGIEFYHKASSKTSFGSAVVRRILPHLAEMDFKLVYDGLTINGARILKEDPDILIDVEAFDKDIVMSLSDSGFALTTNGEWFFYNDTIYKTTPAWRDYFMPIYRSLAIDNRMQITFKNDNAMMFVSHVLPKLKNRHGVVINGVDEMVINTEPEFFITLDCDGNKITAVPSVKYGTKQFRLPTGEFEHTGKIVIRNKEEEEKFLSLLSDFSYRNNSYVMSGDDNIYGFILRDLKLIASMAHVIMTERFKSVKIENDFNLFVTAGYNKTFDYLEIGFESEFSSAEISKILSAIRMNETYYHASDGRFIDLKENKKLDLLQLLETVGVTENDLKNGKKQLSKIEILRLEASKDVIDDESIKEYLESVRNIKPKIPDDLCGELREYQKDGIAWFTELSELGMGGILADDMGLGKTLQTIAFIHGLKPEKPSLIVAPGTLVYNWQRELERFAPDAKFLIISGNKDTRRELLKTVDEYEFIITSYPLLRRDINNYKDIDFAYCVIDEAQYIKNPKTMNAVSVKRIHADRRFALTGTPIENSVMELWSIFDFIMPGYLKSANEFRSKFEGAWDSADISAALRNIIRPFVLRRLKKDVLNELPEKIETTMVAELTKEQKGIYFAYAEEAKKEAAGLIRDGDKITLLTYLLRLRQICSHPCLVDDNYNAKSGKLDLLLELIRDACDGGHNVLVFLQFRKVMSVIERELIKEGFKTLSISGDVPMADRVKICEEFNSGAGDVILVSLKAGGTGINLTGADTVIHFDPWWNPAVTDQATDRAYRIGQTRAVQVIKLASKGTLEEKILMLEKQKRDLAKDIIRTNSKTLKNLTDDELMSLFEV